MDPRTLNSHGFRIAILIGLLLLTAMDVHAAQACRVVDVLSGDTIVADCGAGEKEVRLDGVEGPAAEALFWSRARRDLSTLLLDRTVKIDVQGFDEQGVIRAGVYLGPAYVNERVVSEGLARCHRTSPGIDWCTAVEARAQSGQRGLWSDPWNDAAGTALALDEPPQAPAVARLEKRRAKMEKASTARARPRRFQKVPGTWPDQAL